MTATMERVRTGGGRSKPIIGLLTKETAPSYLGDTTRYPLLAPFLRYLDKHTAGVVPDREGRQKTEVELPAENHLKESTKAEYGLVRYKEVSTQGLFAVVRSLSNPPEHQYLHTPRSRTINFIVPENPEEFDLEPGIYVEKHFAPGSGQQLKPEHIHPMGLTYDEIVVPIGATMLKAETIVRQIELS